MESSVLLSKMRPPNLSRVINRPRLINHLVQNGSKKLAVLLGQAAQGKSTLAASYVQTCSLPTAWLNLGNEESDPVNLFRLMVHAVHNASGTPHLAERILYPTLGTGPRAMIPMYRDWTHRLFRTVPGPLQIVLDGLDRLSPDADAFDLIKVLLDEAPSGIHLLMLSRTRPPFEIERLRIGRECIVVENDQMAFTLEETRSFFKEVYGLSLPQGRLKTVYSFTEGWVGGLILFAIAMERSNRKTFVSEKAITDLKAGAFRYLGEEIFDSLSVEQKDFFIRTSILEVIDPGFVKELIPGSNVEAVIAEAFHRNLFVQPLHHSGKGWQFRYHQIFKDFLQDKFAVALNEIQKRDIFFKAGELSEKTGDLEKSVSYYLDARAYPEAAEVLVRIGAELVREARIGDLKRWLYRLPEEMVEENPWLLFYLCMTRRFSATAENIPSLQRCLDLFAQSGNIRGQMLATAFLIEAMTLGGWHPVPLPEVIKQGELLISTASSERYQYESAILCFQLGLGYPVCMGDPLKGYWCSKKSYLMAKGLGDRWLQAAALTYAMQSLSWLGEFNKAEEISKQIQKLLEKISHPELNTFYSIELCEFLALRGELATAKQVLETCLRAIEQHGLIYLFPLALICRIVIHLGLMEFDEAEKAGRELLHLSTSIGNRFCEGIALTFLSLTLYHRGDYEKGKRYIEGSRSIFSAKESFALYHLNVTKIARGIILRHLDVENSILNDKEIQEALSHFYAVSSPFLTCQAELAIGLRRAEREKPKQAIEHLIKGFSIAEKMKYTHLFILSRPDFAEACIRVLEYDIAECTGYASWLLSTHLADFAEPKLDRLVAHPKNRIAGKAREVRKRVRYAAAPVIRIQSFGQFRAWRGDHLLQTPEWKMPQVRKLLKLLVARGGSQIPTEVVIEDLWPEVDTVSGERNFKTTLHRLRKALEPGMNKEVGSAYIHLENRRISLNPDLFSIDTDEFLSLAEKGEVEVKTGNPKTALSHFEKAVDLYRGEFLAKDLYSAWAQTKRQDLQTKYIAVLSAMARIHEKSGRAKRALECWRKIVKADPLMEEAYRKMMLLYGNLGLRNEALKIFAECRLRLKTEIDAEPEDLTSAIYRKIAADGRAGEPD